MGGKLFKDNAGEAEAIRIPTNIFHSLVDNVIEDLSPFFERMEVVMSRDKKDDHGDIDFVCLTHENSIDLLMNYVDRMGIKHGRNGPIRHILYPYEDHFYKIDLIVTGSEKRYESYKYFYSKDVDNYKKEGL